MGLSLAGQGGCSHTPSAGRDPAFPVPEHWATAAEDGEGLEVTEGLLDLFDDHALQHLVRQVLTNNFDVRIAALRLEEADYQAAIAGASRLPQLEGGLTGGRMRTAGDMGSTRSTYEARLGVSWELDVWDRIGSLRDAAVADRTAVAEDLRALHESIAARAMQRWFDLIAAERLMANSRQKLTSFSDTADLITRRFEAGLGNFADADAARTDQSLAEAELASRTEARRQASRDLVVLTGAYPDPALVAHAEFPDLSHSIPADVPSDILRRRPDLQAAFQRIVAADKRMQASHRDLFPSFRLTAAGGQSSSELDALTNSSATFWSLLGGLSQPLFQANRLRNAYKQSQARAKRAYEEYSLAALNAFAEVEQALSQAKSLAMEEQKTSDALTLARRVYEKSLQDYEDGLLDVLTLLQSQRRIFDLEDRLVGVQRQRLQNRVQLALALGTGV